MKDSPESKWSVLELLNWTKEYFWRAGLAQPRLAGEILLAHVLECERIQLYTRFDQVPSAAQRRAFRNLVLRAGGGEPVAYLIGRKEFYSLTFKIIPGVLIPRPETEILVAEALAQLSRLTRPESMWDVCTGSGCVGITVAVHIPNVSVLATDISPEAVALAAVNAATHRVDDRLCCCVADLLDRPGDWSGPACFDVITANPPYVADGDEVAPVVLHEPALALRAGPDGMRCLEVIIRDAPQVLTEGGALLLEFGCGQADKVRDLIVATGAFAEPRIIRDQQNIERAAVAIRSE